MKALQRLSTDVATWMREWDKSRPFRYQHRFNIVEKFLHSAERNPHKAWAGISIVWALLGALCILLPLYFSNTFGISAFGDGDFQTYFVTLWSLQGGMIALIFPLVISLVSILLEQRGSAGLGFEIYLIYSSAVCTGASSIALVFVMGVQYFGLPYYPQCIPPLMVPNIIWFLINLLLTGRFLLRTRRYLDDSLRSKVFLQFAIHWALPQDMRAHLKKLFFLQAFEDGRIPKNSSKFEGAVYPFSFGRGKNGVVVQNKKPRQVVDIKFGLLSKAVRRWLVQIDECEVSEHEKPRCYLTVEPDFITDENIILCRIENAPIPNRVSAWLFRKAIVFGAPVASNITTQALLEELSAEALSLAEQRRFDSASEYLNFQRRVHISLVRAGAFTNSNGEEDNAGLLEDPYAFAGRKLFQQWNESYRDLINFSVSKLDEESVLFRRLCYLSYHLVERGIDQNIEIVRSFLSLHTLLFYRMGIWFSRAAETSGQLTKIELKPVILRHEYVGIYARALEVFVEGWEAIDFEQRRGEKSGDQSSWNKLSRKIYLDATYLSHSAKMLLESASHGDRQGYSAISDSFLTWWERRPSSMSFLPIPDPGLGLNSARAKRSWDAVKDYHLSVAEDDQDWLSTIGVFDLIESRHFCDSLVTLALIFLNWSMQESNDRSYCLELATPILQALKKHAREAHARTSNSIIIALLRIQFVDKNYREYFDSLVDGAADLRRKPVISGRIYSRDGNREVSELRLAQSVLLTIFTKEHQRGLDSLPKDLTEIIIANRSNDKTLERIARWAKGINEDLDSGKFKAQSQNIGFLRKSLELNESFELESASLKSHLSLLQRDAETIRQQAVVNSPIECSILSSSADKISEILLRGSNEVFPFSIAKSITPSSTSLKDHRFRFLNTNKKPFTRYGKENGDTDSPEWYAETLKNYIASRIVTEFISLKQVIPIHATSEADFSADLLRQKMQIRKRKQTPILLVPDGNIPKWLRPSVRQNGAFTKSIIKYEYRASDDPKTCYGYIDEIPTHRAPIPPPHCYLIAKENFENLKYKEYKGRCLEIDPEDVGDTTMTLVFKYLFWA